MPCPDLQTKLALHAPLTPDEANHAEACPDCAAFAAFDADLTSKLVEWRNPGPLTPNPLSPGTERGLRRPIALAGLGLAAAFTLGVLAFPTRSGATAAYRRMMLQIRQVRTLHLVVRWRPGNGHVEDGPLRMVEELWWKPGALREERPGSPPTLKLGEAGATTFYRYDPSTRQVRSFIETASQLDYRSFDLEKFAAVYMDTPTHFDQPGPTTIIATNAGEWSRMVFTLDTSTGLPSHAEKQHRTGEAGPWQQSGEINLEFDGTMPDERFIPERLKP